MEINKEYLQRRHFSDGVYIGRRHFNCMQVKKKRMCKKKCADEGRRKRKVETEKRKG